MIYFLHFNEFFQYLPSFKLLFYSFTLLSIVIYVAIVYFPPIRALITWNVSGKNVLFIIAHPDDECMFFGPTIRGLSSNNKMSILCLTSGNFYNIGEVRKKELIRSTEVLGISSDNVFIIDKKEIPDHPTIEWDEDMVCNSIIDKINHVSSDFVITFDSYGVSGHVNHIHLYNSMRQILSKARFKSKLKALPVSYSLDSIPIWRKYISILDILCSLLHSRYIFISSIQQVLITQKAMFAHRSQLMWFRRLYIVFSRYMFINTLTEIKPHS